MPKNELIVAIVCSKMNVQYVSFGSIRTDLQVEFKPRKENKIYGHRNVITMIIELYLIFWNCNLNSSIYRERTCVDNVALAICMMNLRRQFARDRTFVSNQERAAKQFGFLEGCVVIGSLK